MYLGIEIGGTKLQLGVGDGSSRELKKLVRSRIVAREGAERIREKIAQVATKLIDEFPIQAIGVGFGGPVQSSTGLITTSHQVPGWNEFPMGYWLREQFDLPNKVINDCDAAALAESKLGGHHAPENLLYVTVGTGIGGGLVVNGKLLGSDQAAMAEIGHLRPGLDADTPDITVESFASGWGMVSVAEELSRRVAQPQSTLTRPQHWYSVLDHYLAVSGEGDALPMFVDDAAEIQKFIAKSTSGPSAADIAKLAEGSNRIAKLTLTIATKVLGWAIAQAINLTCPQTIVIGGGVSLIGQERFLDPLREVMSSYLFPPMQSAYELVPASLGEEVVVHGAIAAISESAKIDTNE